MRAAVTRVSEASVRIDGAVCGSIEKGFLVLLGVVTGDTEAQAKKLADKVCGVRVFEDENGARQYGGCGASPGCLRWLGCRLSATRAGGSLPVPHVRARSLIS